MNFKLRLNCSIANSKIVLAPLDILSLQQEAGSPDAKTFGEIEVTRTKLPNTTLAPTKLLKILILGKTCCFS